MKARVRMDADKIAWGFNIDTMTKYLGKVISVRPIGDDDFRQDCTENDGGWYWFKQQLDFFIPDYANEEICDE
jgi:hypothetical protein